MFSNSTSRSKELTNTIIKRNRTKISDEIKRKIINNLENLCRSRKEVAAIFDLPYLTVCKIYNKFLKTGTSDAKKRETNLMPQLNESHLEFISNALKFNCKLTIKELCRKIQDEFLITVSKSTMHRALVKIRMRCNDVTNHNVHFASDVVSSTSLSNSNSFTVTYSDAARVTQDLDHLLTSFNQNKLNRNSTTNIYDASGSNSTTDHVYGLVHDDDDSDPVKKHSSKNNVSSIPICVQCNEPIYDISIAALNGHWHLEHFLCRGCDMRLETQVYYVDSNQPYCEACHINLFTDKCAYCGEPILDTYLTALDKIWHPEHFFCSSCQGPFDDNVGFHEQQGKPYCFECYFELLGHRCDGCNYTITTSFLSALGKKWHDECFVCTDCKCPFETAYFRDINGAPYCEHHYHVKMGTICGSCNTAIVGSLVSALGRKYHVNCFTCSYCLKRLPKTSFKESKNRLYCTDCYTKLCP